MQGEVIEEVYAAERTWEAWDALAVACSRPYAAPAWQLGWWQAAARPGARPIVLVAREGTELRGVAALYGERGRSGLERLRFMGSRMAQGTAPLAAPGQEHAVARALGDALAAIRPRPATLELEGVAQGDRWAASVRDAWSTGPAPRLQHEQRVKSPVVTLGAGSLHEWMAGRSSNFRQQLRRSRRKLEAQGATFTRAQDSASIQAALPALIALHEDRWSSRGGSAAVDATTGAVLAEAARRLGSTGRMHVEVVELDGATIGAHLFLTAGDEMTYWLGGFDERFAAERVGLLALLDAVEHALGQGVSRLTLGPGDQAYKYRFADADEELDWARLILPGPRRPLTRLQLAPRRLAKDALARLPEERREALLRIARRG